jgi:hypothetical protein
MRHSASAIRQTSTKAPCFREYALKELTVADEARFVELLKKAAS